jgi:peptide/nickel transport system ATP-binding protein
VSGDLIQLVAENVTKNFGSRRSSHVTALDSVSYTFDSTKKVGIVGESGSGKSTLSRIVSGLDFPTTGSIWFNGRIVRPNMPTGELLDLRRNVQYIAQDTSSSFDPRRTLRDAVRAPVMRLHGLRRKAADERVDEVLDLLGLPTAMADRKPSSVSGGQRQRFSIARALVVRPRILMCDEVVSALDVSVQGSILNQIRQFCADHDTGLVFVSHGLPATAFICDELVVMRDGRIVEQGSVDDVVERPVADYTKHLLDAHTPRPSRLSVSPEPKEEMAAAGGTA